MSVERKLLFVKLIGFQTGEISKNEIYEWALFVAVSSDYEELIKNDKLAEQIMQFLIDIDKPRTSTTPTKTIVDYFLSCLEEKKQFSEEYYKALIADQPAKQATAAKTAAATAQHKAQKISIQQQPSVTESATDSKKKSAKEIWIPLIARIYVALFVGVSIVLNLLVIFKSDFLLKQGEIAPLPDEVWRDAFPHLFYGLTMIVALIIKGPRILLLALFFVAAWGMFFYWYSITMFIFHNKWPLYYLVMLSPILTLPPTMMFWIMLKKWFNIRNNATVEQVN